MKSEGKFCELKTAKELKALGVEQKSLFGYFGSDKAFGSFWKWEILFNENVIGDPECAAFTAGEAIDAITETAEDKFILEIYWNAGEAIAMCDHGSFQDKNLAEAICQLWIGLIKKGIVKP